MTRSMLIAIAVCLMPVPAMSHGGGLDANGCHTNRRTGDYHCHRGPPVRTAPPAFTTGFADGRSSARASGAYANCAAARAAGAAPVRRGEPGYGPHLDRDGDGVGCE